MNDIIENGDLSFFKKRRDGIYTIIYLVSSNMKISSLLNILLFFIEDIQFGYFIISNSNVVSLSEKIRSLYSFIVLDNISYDVFQIIQISFSAINIVVYSLIFYYVFIQNLNKLKNNAFIKLLKVYAILFDSILFLPFINGIFKSLMIKENYVVAYPSVLFESNIIMMIISIIAILCYIPLFFMNSIFFVSPISFSKYNSRIQSYSCIGLKYNTAKLIIVLYHHVSSSYFLSYEKFTNFFILIGFSYLLSTLINTQSYYRNIMNEIKSGLWAMIFMMSLMIFISSIFKFSHIIYTIISVAMGVLSFFFGFFYYRYRSSQHIKNIYINLKEINTSQKQYYGSEDTVNKSISDVNDNENLHRSISGSISKNSEGTENNEKENNSESDEEEEESNDRESSIAESEDSEDIRLINNKLRSKINSFNSMDKILSTINKKEPIVVFKNSYDFEIACRFIKHNESIEAFQLIRDLYKECHKHYSGDPYIYIYYSYFLIYINMKSNNKYEKVEKDTYENDKIALRNILSSNISNALSCKNSFISNYFIRYINIIIKNKYDTSDSSKVRSNSQELQVIMHRKAVNGHLSILSSLKEFFRYIKYYEVNNESYKFFNLSDHLISLNVLKRRTFYVYQNLLNSSYNTSYQLYDMFITNTLSLGEIEEYAKSTDNAIITVHKKNEDDELNNYEDNNEETITTNNIIESSNPNYKIESQKLNIDIEAENNLKRVHRWNLISKYTQKTKLLSKTIYSVYVIQLSMYTLINLININHLYQYYEIIHDYYALADVDYYINNLLTEIKLLALALMDKDEDMIYEHLDYIESDYLVNIESIVLPLLKEYSHVPSSKNPIISYGSGKSEFIYLNAYETVKKFDLYGHNLLNIPYEEYMSRVDNKENMLEDDIMKTMLVNYPDHADKVLQDTIDYIMESDNSANSSRRTLIFSCVGILAVLSFFGLLYGITPLINYSRQFQYKAVMKFKQIMNCSINELISKFDDDVNAIIDTYEDVGSNYIKGSSRGSSTKLKYFYNKSKGLVITVISLLTLITITLPVIYFDNYIKNHLVYNFKVGERKDLVLDIFMFDLETLIQDHGAYAPGVTEGRLYQKIVEFENLQNQIYNGELGLESTNKMDFLDEIFISHECINLDMSWCEEVEEAVEYDFTEEFVKLSLDEMIAEYIERSRAILRNTNLKYEKTQVDLYQPTITVDNCQEYRHKFYDDKDYSFIYDSFDYIQGTIQQFEAYIYDILYTKTKEGIIYVVLFYVIGMILFSVSIYLTVKLIKEINTGIKELINIAIIVPKPIVDNTASFKRFIERGVLEY